MNPIPTDITAQQFLIGLLAAGILAALKAFGPELQKKVPNFLWPIAVLFLSKAGSAICAMAGAGCSGNPLGWTSVDTTALATAFVAVSAREIAKSSTNGFAFLKQWFNKESVLP